MYDITLVYRDYQRFTVEVSDDDFTDFMKALNESRTFFDEEKNVGFWLPPESVRCAYIKKKESQCHEIPDPNQSL